MFGRQSRPNHRPAFDVGARRAGFGLSGGDASGFTRCAGAQAQLDLFLLPHGPYEIAALLACSTVQAFAGLPRLLCRLLTPALRSGCLPTSSVPLPGQQRRPPEVRSIAFTARPSDLPPRPLMAVDFAVVGPLVRPGRPHYPLLVHRAAALLHASFRPRLAATPLRFANPSPPSGWIEDLHLQATDHARHTYWVPRSSRGTTALNTTPSPPRPAGMSAPRHSCSSAGR